MKRIHWILFFMYLPGTLLFLAILFFISFGYFFIETHLG